MTAVLDEIPPSGGWTTDDLDAMPEDNRRRELLDGALLLCTSSTGTHQFIAAHLMVALDEQCPDDRHATMAMELRIDRRRSLIPDGLVIIDGAARPEARFFAPHEVVLAVEVVESTSLIMDRITRPAVYAAARIPFFWRIETDGEIVVHTYRLDEVDNVYRPLGTFRDVIKLQKPWPIEIPISRLTPRHYQKG